MNDIETKLAALQTKQAEQLAIIAKRRWQKVNQRKDNYYPHN